MSMRSDEQNSNGISKAVLFAAQLREGQICQGQVWRGNRNPFAPAVVPTGFASLDRELPGSGWPHRSITEIFLERYGIGELSLLAPALAALLRRDEDKKWIVFIAPPFIPYAPALIRHGIAIDRVLLVHPSTGTRNCVWAVEQAVRAGSSTAVLAWVSAANGIVLRRLQLAAEKHWCWTFLFRPLEELEERSPAALRIRLASEAGAVTRVQILKSRGGQPATVCLRLRRACDLSLSRETK
jgi:protein ImuA